MWNIQITLKQDRVWSNAHLTIMLTDLAAVVLIKSQGCRTLITKQKPAAVMWPPAWPYANTRCLLLGQLWTVFTQDLTASLGLVLHSSYRSIIHVYCIAMIVYKIWEVSVKAYLAIHINNAIDPLKLWCLFWWIFSNVGNLIFIKKSIMKCTSPSRLSCYIKCSL